MITQEQYELGVNRDAKPWMMLSDAAQAIIKAFGDATEELAWTGKWVRYEGGLSGRHAGCSYRIKPDTPYTVKGEVAASDIQGLKLKYTSGGACILEFRDGSSVANISIASLISMCEQQCFGSYIMSSVLRQFENRNRPKE